MLKVRAAPRVCGACGSLYQGAHRDHLNAAGHGRSRSSCPPKTEFLESLRAHPEQTIRDVGATHGLRPEAAKRAASKAGLFRRGRRGTNLVRDQAILRRSKEGISRRQLADEYGLSLSHIYYTLRLARASG
jgi:hypothetical protein